MATNVTETPAAPAAPAIADPAPLGLAGFGMTTFLLSGYNAGFIHSGEFFFLGMALFYGGLAQFCAGMWEFKRNNTFGATAFSSYGAFWMGYAVIVIISATTKTSFLGQDGIAWFLLFWGIFTTYMFIASLRVSVGVALVFLLLALTYYALWGGQGLHEAAGDGWTLIGGWLGLFTAGAAFYVSFAGVVNLTFGRVILPVFPLNVPLLKAR
jgi:succinate-acetate transporter protein